MEENNNQAAPDTDNAVETVQDPVVDTNGTEGDVTTQTPETQVPTFNPQTSYDALQKELEGLRKSYGEIRKVYTQNSQNYSALQKQMEQMSQAFAQATQQEISPEEFMKSLQTQGIKAFEPLKDQWTKALKDDHNKALQERDSVINKLQVDMAILARSSDPTNYPDFAKLKPVMQEIAESDNCPVDWNQSVDVIYDTLYKLARDLKAEDSIKSAHSLGQKEAEAKAAKEAASAVVAGGKTNAMGVDPKKMSAADLKKHFAKLGMVGD